MRTTTLAPLLVVLALGALAGCGQSKADKANDKVCDARDDIGQQVEELQRLTITTATTDQISNSVRAIQSDLKDIAAASGDLSDERRKEVQSANDAFTATIAQIGNDLGTNLSLESAATQVKAALRKLADSYRQTFGQLDCS